MTMPMTNNAALDGGRETVVQFDHLQHVYPGGVEALKDINLSFRKGEIVAIIGQNGSGKTTLSKHFNGLLRPTSGTVKVCGRDIGKVRTSDLAKTVGYVFQNPNYQIFCASVRDEIKYGLKNLKLPENEIKTRTKEILAQFGLTSVAKTQPVSLSGGTKKVVALASVCAMDPSILLLDEPTTGQDQPGKQRLGQLMLSLSASGKTIIVISHDMNFVARYAQRVIVMAEGRVIGDDTPARIFSNESVMKQAHVQPPQVYAVVNELRREGQSIPEEAYTCSQAARRDERSRAMQSVTLYYPGTSFFHLCDCRVKLLLMLIFTVIAFLFYNPIVPAALFIAALLMNLSAIGTRTFKNFLFKMILVMMAFLLVLHGFANPNGSVPAQFWGHQLRIPFFGCYTVDGVLAASLIHRAHRHAVCDHHLLRRDHAGTSEAGGAFPVLLHAHYVLAADPYHRPGGRYHRLRPAGQRPAGEELHRQAQGSGAYVRAHGGQLPVPHGDHVHGAGEPGFRQHQASHRDDGDPRPPRRSGAAGGRHHPDDRCYCNPGPLREPELGIPGGLLEPRVAAAAVRRPYESACIGI